MAALYTSTTLEAAWREAQQGFVFKAQPMTLCAYEVDCDDVADLTDPATRTGPGVEASDMACPWKDLATTGVTPPSWTLARRLFATGLAAIVAPSFVPGALEADRTVVFWRWSDTAPHRVKVVDDARRLPKDERSWAD